MRRSTVFISVILILILCLSSCKSDIPSTDGSYGDTDTDTDTSDTKAPDDPVTDPEDKYITAPLFSHTGGIYASAISLELTQPKDHTSCTIRYTRDGSVPNKRSDKYTQPISLDGDTDPSCVIRAALFDGDTLVGKVMTHTYIFDRKASSDLWVVSITAEPSELSQMISNYNEKIEIPSHTEIVTPKGSTVISQDTGLRIFGGSSREHAQKSFKVIARKTEKLGNDIYMGKGSFSYPLFADRVVISGDDAGKVLEKYDSFILRNGGNDSLNATAADPQNPTLLRDHISNAFAQKVLSSFDYSLSQFAAVYVNGEYYGILDMRENMNEDYVKNVYGVDDDLVTVVKSELDTTRYCGDPYHSKNGSGCRFCGSWFYYETDDDKQADLKDWISLCKKALNAKGSDFEKVFSEIEQSMDLDSFAEYMALNMYLCNTDWPHNNVKIWRYSGEPIDRIEITDGKWRFMYRDMDFTMGRYESMILPEINTVAQVNMFYRTLGNYRDFNVSDRSQLYPDSLYLQGLLDFCLQNKDFLSKFTDICTKLASNESTAILRQCYNDAYRAISGEMSKHIKRWNHSISGSYSTMTWAQACAKIQTFINKRPSIFRSQLQEVIRLYH